MTRKSTSGRLLQRIPSPEMAELRMGKENLTEHGLRAAHRAWIFLQGLLGCDGIARNSDRVSIDHFLSELDKACRRERQVN